VNEYRIEEIIVVKFNAIELNDSCRKLTCQLLNAICDRFESVRTVIDVVHAGHNGEENLGGADVGGGFFAADVLFAGLDGEAVGRVAVGVAGESDDAAREFAGEFIFAGHEGSMRSAVAHGDAEALGAADG